MKKIGLIFFTLSVLVGCEKESDNYFDATVDASSISFRPIPGGAIMSYNIPESKSIHGINLTYISSTGKEMTVGGSYGSNELTIKGFLYEESAVPAKVTYLSRDNKKSKSTDVTFPTLAAGAVSIFDNIKVQPYWGGFSVTFEAPENVDGLINIGYMGINPTTGNPGIILKETKVIAAGENKLLYNNIVNDEQIIKTVIWTEDLYQNEAKRESYDVMPKMTRKLDSSTLSYEGDSYEYPYYKLSKDYLFDGDTKGLNSFQNKNGNYAFSTDSDVIVKPEGVIDLKEPQTLAYFRMYATLKTNYKPSGSVSITDGAFANHFKLFASNNSDINSDEWVEIAEYNQSSTQEELFWWCFPSFDPSKTYKNIDDLRAADPCFIDVNFDVSGTKYRYLKIQFLSIFKSTAIKKRAFCSEMEVFVEK